MTPQGLEEAGVFISRRVLLFKLHAIATGDLSCRTWAWKSLWVEFDFRIVDVPGLFILDPHQRDLEQQSGTLIDGTSTGGNSSSGLA